MTPLDIDYLPVEYCFDRGFDVISPYTVGLPELLDVYEDSSKLNGGVDNAVFSGRLNLKISLQMPNYCSVFQDEVMASYQCAQ